MREGTCPLEHVANLTILFSHPQLLFVTTARCSCCRNNNLSNQAFISTHLLESSWNPSRYNTDMISSGTITMPFLTHPHR